MKPKNQLFTRITQYDPRSLIEIFFYTNKGMMILIYLVPILFLIFAEQVVPEHSAVRGSGGTSTSRWPLQAGGWHIGDPLDAPGGRGGYFSQESVILIFILLHMIIPGSLSLHRQQFSRNDWSPLRITDARKAPSSAWSFVTTDRRRRKKRCPHLFLDW